jgi:hypothetical protein
MSSTAARTALLLLLAACGPEETPEPTPALTLSESPARVRLETVAEGAGHAVLAGPGRLIAEGPAGVRLLDARRAEPLVLDALEGPVQAAAPVDGELLALVDGALWTVAIPPRPSPLDEALDAPAEGLWADGASLWLQAGRALRWSRGELVQVDLDDAPATGPIVAGAPHRDGEVTWVRAGADRVALDEGLAAVDAIAVAEGSDFAVDGRGTAWFTEDGVLLRRALGDAVPEPTGLDGVDRVMAHPADKHVWVRTGTGAWVGDDARLAPVELPEGDWLAADASGRLLLATGDGVLRVEPAPAVRILDADGVLRQPTALVVAPSRMADVEEVRLTLGDEAFDLTGPPFTHQVVPADHPPGPLDLTVEVRWTDGETARAVQRLTLEDGTVTWAEDVQPLYQARCSACHTAEDAVPLSAPADWTARFDEVLEQVTTGAMPLGPETLSDDEIDLLRAWEDAGFPE